MATEDAVLEASRLDFGGPPAVILDGFSQHTLVEVRTQFKGNGRTPLDSTGLHTRSL